MKKLINTLFAGKSIATSKGTLEFDKEGACMLEDEVADTFKNIKGFVVENDSKNNDNSGDDKDLDKSLNAPENTSNASEDGKENTEENSVNDDKVDLESLSVLSLKKYAKERGIDITGMTTKESILKVIKDADQR